MSESKAEKESIEPGEWWTLSQASAHTGKSSTTIRKDGATGKVRTRIVGTETWYDPSSFDLATIDPNAALVKAYANSINEAHSQNRQLVGTFLTSAEWMKQAVAMQQGIIQELTNDNHRLREKLHAQEAAFEAARNEEHQREDERKKRESDERRNEQLFEGLRRMAPAITAAILHRISPNSRALDEAVLSDQLAEMDDETFKAFVAIVPWKSDMDRLMLIDQRKRLREQKLEAAKSKLLTAAPGNGKDRVDEQH